MRIPMPCPNNSNFEGLYIDSPSAAYDSRYGVRMPRAVDNVDQGAVSEPMENEAMDDEPKRDNAKTIDKMCAHASKQFGQDDWKSLFTKMGDAHNRSIGGGEAEDADEPPDFPGKPRRPGVKPVGASDAASDAAFLNRFPSTFAIGRDDGYGRPANPRSAGREMSSKDAARFDAMFPGAGRIRTL